MLRRFAALLVLFAGGAHAAGEEASAPPPPLDIALMDALRLAAERAPTVLAARQRVDLARARLFGAQAWLVDNPMVEVGAGARSKPAGWVADLEVALEQRLDLGGRQGARRAAATAAIDEATAFADDVARGAMWTAGDAFVDALAAAQGASLTERAVAHASALAELTRKRVAAGEVSVVDARLAETQLARAHAAHAAAQANRVLALGRLRLTLGLSPDVALSLAPAGLALAAPPTSGERADVRAAKAARARVTAELRDADAGVVPVVALRTGYALDDGDHVISGALSIDVPAFQHGQGEAAAARSERAALDVEITTLTNAALTEAATARAAHAHWRDAHVAATRAAAAAAEAARLARTAYDAGEGTLTELLMVERESIGAEQERIDAEADEARQAIAVYLAEGGAP